MAWFREEWKWKWKPWRQKRFGNSEHENIGRKNSVIWNHNDFDLIRVTPNHAESNQLIQDDSTKIGSINDSANILAIEKMLSWSGKSKDATAHASPTGTNTHALPVNLVRTPSLVPTPRTFFTCATASDVKLIPHDSSSESVIHKGNPTPSNNPPIPVPNVPADPDSDPSLLDYSLSDSFYLSVNEYSWHRQFTKNK